MTQPITGAFPDELIPWMDAHAGNEKTYRSRSQLIVEAVRHLRVTIDGHGGGGAALTLESSTQQDPRTAALTRAVGEVLAVSGLPMVTPGKSSRKVDLAVATPTVRRLDILREELDIPHRVTADIVRACIDVTLDALDTLIMVEHAAWRAMTLAARAGAEQETRLMYESALEDRAADFHQDVVAAITRGDDQDALRHYADFFRFAEALPIHLRDDGLRFLATLPIAQEVAYRFPGLVPDPELVPRVAPNPMALHDSSGLYRSPHSNVKRKGETT